MLLTSVVCKLGRRKRLAHTYPPAHFTDPVVCRKTEQKTHLLRDRKKIDMPLPKKMSLRTTHFV